MQQADATLVRRCLGEIYPERQLFAARFYERFLLELPAARRLFVNNREKQELMLYSVMSMTIRGMETGRDLHEELEEFGCRHAHIGVKEAYFPVFGSVFLETLYSFLPDCNRADLAASWWAVFTDMSEPVLTGLRREKREMDLDRRPFADQIVDLESKRSGDGRIGKRAG